MDHNELKASETESSSGHPSSPDKQSRLAKENSLVDANVGIQKKLSGLAEKLAGIERSDRISYSGCTKESKTDKQGKTESSSSNTPHVVRPASSNESCQETSLEIQPCKLRKIYATDSSTCTDLNSSRKELAAGIRTGMKISNPDDAVSPAKGCNTVKVSEILDSVRTRNSDNLSGLRSSDNLSGMSSESNYVAMERIDGSKTDLFKKETKKVAVHGKAEQLHKIEDVVDAAPAVAKEVDQDFEASGSSSSVDGRNSDRFPRSFVDSVGSNGKSCLTVTGSESQQSKGEDKSFSFCSMKEAGGPRLSVRSESLCMETKVPLPGMFPNETREVSDSLHGRESPFQTMKAVGLSPSDCSGGVSKIDLNEDFLDHNVEYFGQAEKETVPSDLMGSVSKPKPVMAKPGTPLCFLAPRTENEGKLGGWRGSTKTSAFQPTSTTKNGLESNKASPTDDENGGEKHSVMKGIDLNLDAAGADFDVHSLQSKSPLTEVGSTQPRRLDFDLNCVSGNDENFHQSSPTTSLSKKSVRDFDLNDNPVPTDTGNFTCQPDQVSEALRKAVPDSPLVSYMESSKQQDFKSSRPAYSADLRSVPGFITSHAQPFLVAAPNMTPSTEHLQRVSFFQPQLAYTPSMHHAFRVDPKDGLYSAVGPHGMVPYMVDPLGTPIMSPVIGSGAVPAFPAHVFQVTHGSSPNNAVIPRPNVEAYNALDNASRGSQFGVPLGNNASLEEQMKSFQQVGVSAAAGMKRREPEGGWDSPQLCFRQMTSWR